ncbi:MAG: lipocalin family protein [Saprospiraceae bacterium]|nr:lipocalin family protein [Saprospiraceae bacterium]
MKTPVFFPFVLILLMASNACQQSYRQEQLYGTWQVDSVYAFYNGFGYWQYEDGYDWANYVYLPDGRLEEVKYDNPRYFRYQLSGDTLFWESLEEAQGGVFKVLSLQRDNMVLRKDKPSMFGNPNEERYEIRFFSRREAEK